MKHLKTHEFFGKKKYNEVIVNRWKLVFEKLLNEKIDINVSNGGGMIDGKKQNYLSLNVSFRIHLGENGIETTTLTNKIKNFDDKIDTIQTYWHSRLWYYDNKLLFVLSIPYKWLEENEFLLDSNELGIL